MNEIQIFDNYFCYKFELIKYYLNPVYGAIIFNLRIRFIKKHSDLIF